MFSSDLHHLGNDLNGRSDRLPVIVEPQPPSPASQDQTILPSGGNTPVPFVTNAALDEVKDSIQELRSILLRGRGEPYEEPYYGYEMDNRSRRSRSRQSGGFGPPFEPHNSPIIIPDYPPPGVVTIPWQPNPGVLRPRQAVRLQSPSRSPIIIQPARSRSSSRDRYNNVDTGISRHGRTDATGQELESVISDFSSIVIIATFLASVSIVMLELARNVYDSPETPKSSVNKAFYIILQVFASLSLSFNLSVAIVAGGAASSQSLRLRLGQRASDFSRSQSLDTKLQLCSTMQYYGLLCLTVATACTFALLLNSPYAVLMIIPVIGVVFYDSLFRGKVSSSSGLYS